MSFLNSNDVKLKIIIFIFNLKDYCKLVHKLKIFVLIKKCYFYIANRILNFAINTIYIENLVYRELVK